MRSFVKVLAVLAGTVALATAAPPRNDWYRDTPVSLHFDNHSELLGRGYTVEQLTAILRGIPVGMIEVSARSGRATFASQHAVPTPGAEAYDTLAVWKQVARNLGLRYWIYVDVMSDALTAQHPEWLRVDAKGKRNDRTCLRPSLDGKGYLEAAHLPFIEEVIARYHPDGFWFDGDWGMPLVCYCDNCRRAWKAETGEENPPVDAKDPQWERWVRLEQRRLDEYKRKLAETIHRADAHCLYTGNWSWAISQRDPRQPPEWVDTLSGDVGAGSSSDAIVASRFAALFNSAQDQLPHDVMSAIYPKPVRSLARTLQEGALVMSGGGNWFTWLNHIDEPSITHARVAAKLVDDRRAALGRTHSANPVAVLLSETEWERLRPTPDQFDYPSPRAVAFALQDQGYGVDVVNEFLLAQKLEQYSMVWLADQQELSASIRERLDAFAKKGGRVVKLGKVADADAASLVKQTLDGLHAGPMVRFNSDANLVFALRERPNETILHVADLTSYVGGKRVAPASSHAIDENQIIRNLQVTLAMPKAPRSVRVLPLTTRVESTWSDGKLRLTLHEVSIHAAVLIDGEFPSKWPLLPIE
jgi:hypothetical protein